MISHKAKLISRNEKEALLLVQSGSKCILVASVVSLLLHLINDKCLLLQFSLHFTHLNTFSSAIFFQFILLKNKNKKQTCHQNIVKFNTFSINYNSLVINTKINKKHLIVCKTSSFVCCEDLCDRVDVGCCSQINAKIVLLSCLHDCLGCPLHGVVKTRVDNVLL